MKKKGNAVKIDHEAVSTNVIFSNQAIQSWDVFKKFKIDSIFLKDTLTELILYFERENTYAQLTYSHANQKLEYGIFVNTNNIVDSYKKDPHYTWYTTWNAFPIFVYMIEVYDWKRKEKNLIIRSSSMAGEIYYIAGDRDISWHDKTKEFKIRNLNHGIISPITSVAFTAMLVKESFDRFNSITHESLCILQNDNTYKEAFRFFFNNLKYPSSLMDCHGVIIPNSSINFVDEKSIDIVLPENVLNSTGYMKFYGLDSLILHVATNPTPFDANDIDTRLTEKVYITRIWYTQGHSYTHMLINPGLVTPSKKKEDSKLKE